jgi:hypothetical protein
MSDFTDLTGLRVVQICPSNVGGGGVADFAQVLADIMESQGIHQTIVRASREGISWPTNFVLNPHRDVILLHFSGYEYAHRGLCFWIVKLIDNLIQEKKILGLVTYFHEIYAFGPPWRSGFWVSPFHRYFAFKVQAASDKIFTNTDEHVRKLRGLSFKKRDVVCLPVYSNVNEPETRPAFQNRDDVAVMFGIEQNRRRGLAAFGGGDGLKRIGIHNVIEIGPGSTVGEGISGWHFVGRLEKADVSRHLINARFGLVTHKPSELAKSSVFAAYAAHGCVPLLPHANEELPNGLRTGWNVAFIDSNIDQISDDTYNDISSNVYQWYSGHTSNVVANTIITRGLMPFATSAAERQRRSVPVQ